MDSFIFKKKEKIQNLETEQITGEKNEKNPTKNYNIFLKKDQTNANFLTKKLLKENEEKIIKEINKIKQEQKQEIKAFETSKKEQKIKINVSESIQETKKESNINKINNDEKENQDTIQKIQNLKQNTSPKSFLETINETDSKESPIQSLGSGLKPKSKSKKEVNQSILDNNLETAKIKLINDTQNAQNIQNPKTDTVNKNPGKKKANNPFMNSLKNQSNPASGLFQNIAQRNNQTQFPKSPISLSSQPSFSPISNQSVSTPSYSETSQMGKNSSPLVYNKNSIASESNYQSGAFASNNRQLNFPKINQQPSFTMNRPNHQTFNISSQTNGNRPSSLMSLASNYQKNSDDLFFKNNGALGINGNATQSTGGSLGIRPETSNNLIRSIGKPSQYNTNSTSYSRGNDISFNNSSGFANRYGMKNQERGISFENKASESRSFLNSNSFLNQRNGLIQNEQNSNYESGSGASIWNRSPKPAFGINTEKKPNFLGSHRPFDGGNLSPIGKNSNFRLIIHPFLL